MIKCKMKVHRIVFPKSGNIATGDFAIIHTKVVKVLDGDTPITHPKYETVTIKGNMPTLKTGQIYTFTIDNPVVNEFGTTYESLGVTVEVDPNDKKQVKAFLKTICGVKIAEELMKIENGYQLLMERNSEELLKVKGIGQARLESIYDNLSALGDNSYAIAKLEPLGLSKKLINTLCQKLGGSASAVEMCFNSPYQLIDKVKGISFIKADEIARKVGFTDERTRVKYLISFILETGGDSGKSYLTAGQLMTEVKRYAMVDFSFVNEIIYELIISKKIELSADGNMVALKEYITLESSIAKEVMRIAEAESLIEVPENWMDIVREIEDRQMWNFTGEQLKGIEAVLNNNIVVIKGLAGTGKSTITNAMAEILDDYAIDMCCLSAKASQRLREVTSRNAQTIHKLLGLGFANKEGEIEELLTDILILDEASMVNGTLFLKLLSAVRNGTKIIILGDDGQLTSIGNCAVFSDLISTKAIPVVELTQIHRQAEKSAIITESRKIRNQMTIYEPGFRGRRVLGELQDLELFVDDYSVNLLEEVRNKVFSYLMEEKGNIMEVQIITPIKHRGELSADIINKEIQRLYNPMNGDFFEGKNKINIFTGDKVINLKNNYAVKDRKGEHKEVYNGSIGKVVDIYEDYCVIDFIGIGEVIIDEKSYDNINLAYAISVHSSQGSQWKKVICAIDSSSYMLLNVEMLYTAITRASEKCALLIQHKAMNQCLRKVEQKTKQTLLPMYLNQIKESIN